MSCNLPIISFAEETIRIAIGEWAPFYSENYKHYGLVPHIVTESFALEDIKVEYGFFPWARSLKLTEDGVWDATCCWSEKNKERLKKFLFSDRVLAEKLVFFHLKSFSFDWNTVEDLKGIEIGTTLGYSYGIAFDEADKNGTLQVEHTPSDEINFRKLLAGRIKIFPIDEIAGYFIIRRDFKEKVVNKFTHHPKTIIDNPQRLLISKKLKHSKRIRKLFNKGLNQLKESGIYDQYFGDFRKGEYIIK